MAQMFQQASSAEEYARLYCARMTEVFATLDFAVIARMIDAIERTVANDGALYFIANGGSAATASHWVNDLVAGSYVEGKPRLRAYCLTDNVATVTALGNDAGFDNIFSHQLRVDLRPNDLVFAMSVSGNSENVLRGIDYAKSIGAVTVAACGFDGGKLVDRADIALLIPASKDEYGPVEDVFNILDHIITGWIAMSRGKWLHH